MVYRLPVSTIEITGILVAIAGSAVLTQSGDNPNKVDSIIYD